MKGDKTNSPEEFFIILSHPNPPIKVKRGQTPPLKHPQGAGVITTAIEQAVRIVDGAVYDLRHNAARVVGGNRFIIGGRVGMVNLYTMA